jgi:hypothetical protein
LQPAANNRSSLTLRSIAIGNALQFRQLLLEAQRAVGDKEMPYISHAVGDIFDQVCDTVANPTLFGVCVCSFV